MTNTVDYGIDLGTTNSCIAHWDGSSVRVFQNNDHMNVTPSAVHILKSGRVIVGRRGNAAILTDPDNVSVEFKRWMGQKDRKYFPLAQRELSAEELSAEIIKSLREDVRRQTSADVTTAVITVPAAFGALQCEATARAAHLAGLEEAALLQEPIAAAIGYGARPDTANQRWLVFDLGGGTLDIAVVSTRDGRLNVLEHRGDNLLGGKDIDRLIVERILLPALGDTYDLTATGPDASRSALLPRLRLKAEEAKIDLSSDTQVIISLSDLGNDDSGKSIDFEVQLTRTELERLTTPLLEKCCLLAQEALSGARLSGGDLDRVLLVGGPTRTPVLRAMLSSRFGVPVDFSEDPMTVVGRGAAIYASTLARTNQKPAAASPQKGGADRVSLKLAYDPVSAEVQTTVAGKVLSPIPGLEIKFEAEDGLWTSGWMTPTQDFFEVQVSLRAGSTTKYWVYARDSKGRLLETDVTEFKVRHGLVPSAPPLPHTLSVELLNPGGKPVLDPVFSKGTPLPAEKKLKYRAIHDLVPDNPGSDLAIKLWEGEFLDDPNANEWVGNMVISNTAVKRSVPEGAEIEVTITIDASRLIKVEAFVPHLNQHFSEHVYVAQREEPDFADLSRAVASETKNYRRRLEELERTSASTDSASVRSEIADLRRSIDELDSKGSPSARPSAGADPDEARRVVETSKKVRGRLSRLEAQSASGEGLLKSLQFVAQVELAEEVVEKFGTSLERQQLALLRRELERAAGKEDDKAIRRTCSEIEGLRWRVLGKQDWFWVEIFDSLRKPHSVFVDAAQAEKLIAKGQSAISSGNGETLREVVRALWQIQPKDTADLIRERSLISGLRKF